MMAQKLLTTTARCGLLKITQSHRLAPAVLNQSTMASIQPREKTTPVRVGDHFLMQKKRFSKQDILNYSQMTMNMNPVHLDQDMPATSSLGKPAVHESLIYGAFSGCADQYMDSKGTVTVLLNCSAQHPEPLYVGEDMQAELTVIAREGRKVKLQLLSKEVSSGKVVGQAVADCLMPKGYPE